MQARERVILSLDTNMGRAGWVADQVNDIISSVQLGLLGRVTYQSILDLKNKGFRVYVHLPCIADPDLLKSEYKYLKYIEPDMISVMVHCGASSMGFMGDFFQTIEIAAVLSIDSVTENEYQFLYGLPSGEIVVRLAQLAKGSGITSLICSPREFRILQLHDELLPLTFYVRNVVPSNKCNQESDNPDLITLEEAITGGAAKLIVSDPINCAENPRSAMMDFVDEVTMLQKKIEKDIVGRTTRTIDPSLVKEVESRAR